MKFVLVDECKRSVLQEGRNYGVAFALAKRDGNTLTTVQPLSPCKDYLNDVVYTEHTGKPYQAYGLKTKQHGLFPKDDSEGYLVFAILDHHNGQPYKLKAEQIDYLNAHLDKLQAFINFFDKGVAKGEASKMAKIEDNRFVAIFPAIWHKSTFAISLYSLLIRIAVENGYTKGDPLKTVYSGKTGDTMMVSKCKAKIERMLSGDVPVQDMMNLTEVHNRGGILNYQF